MARASKKNKKRTRVTCKESKNKKSKFDAGTEYKYIDDNFVGDEC